MLLHIPHGQDPLLEGNAVTGVQPNELFGGRSLACTENKSDSQTPNGGDHSISARKVEDDTESRPLPVFHCLHRKRGEHTALGSNLANRAE